MTGFVATTFFAVADPRQLFGRAAVLASFFSRGGEHATLTELLWWRYFWVAVLVYVLVIAAVLIVGFRSRRSKPEMKSEEVLPLDPQRERRKTVIVGTATGATLALLLFLLVSDLLANQHLNEIHQDNPPSIQLIGHQWWWEVIYEDPQASNTMQTANELVIPVGRPVLLKLFSRDVIHSFWIPALNGKKDLIPGHSTTAWIKADKPGTYDGQCAEFCGYQHAHMRLRVTAVSEDEYNKWIQAQRQNAPSPQTDSQRRGEHIFLSTNCALCHTIDGTAARGTVGPSLSHLASRTTLAAGLMPNTRGHLAGWILNADDIKPGVRMPPNPLNPDDLQALLDYLQTLH